jgi:glycosyltransferase involved in cell wall biosynthesis
MVMKKYLLVLGFFIAGMNQVNAQYYDNLNFNINDSLKLVASTNSAAKKIDILMNIGYRYEWSMGDTAVVYFKQAEKIAQDSKDDLALFKENKLIGSQPTDVLPGSGINLHRFSPVKASLEETLNPTFKFLLIARMLKDKGIVEYVNAAQMLKESGFNAEFYLLGFLDVENPAAISTEQMKAWTEQGFVKYLGSSDDVKEYIAQAQCIVLPSYREGTPRTLLEAAAMAKPIITTNVVGCKEVVVDGENGMLCEVKNADELARKMKEMLLLSDVQRKLMGQKGRFKMVREFDENIVILKYVEAIDVVLKDQIVS